MRQALVLAALLAACASPKSEVEETVHEVATPTLAAAMASLGALLGGVPGAAIGAAAGAIASEVFVSKGISEARKEGAADLWAVLNGDDPDQPLPRRLQRQSDSIDGVRGDVQRVSADLAAAREALAEAQNAAASAKTTAAGWFAEIKSMFWMAVLIAGSIAALIFGFQLVHYWKGSRVSRRIAADDDLYELPR